MWFSVITILLLCLAKKNNREYRWIWFTCNYSSLVNGFYICHQKSRFFRFSYDINCSLALFLKKKKIRTALCLKFSTDSRSALSLLRWIYFSRVSQFVLSLSPIYIFFFLLSVTDFYYWILLPLSDPQAPLKVFYSLIKFDNN